MPYNLITIDLTPGNQRRIDCINSFIYDSVYYSSTSSYFGNISPVRIYM